MATITRSWIGCSGWQYKHWRGAFYPEDLPQNRWFDYYASRFDTVEINNTFYRLPEGKTFAQWARRVNGSFLYSIKASRYLTHMKKLRDPEEPLEHFFSRARRLGKTFGPVLYQLPPRWTVNLERLTLFVRNLPKRRRHTIEFRDPSWYREDVFKVLTDHGVALCLHDMAGCAPTRRTVGPFVYIRFHGPTKYSGRYDNRAIDDWAAWIAAQMRRGLTVFAYFNNDIGGHAPRDAARLRRAIATSQDSR